MKSHLRLWPLACLLIFFTACTDIDEAYEVLPVTDAPSLESNHITWAWTELYLKIEKDLPGFRPAPTCRAMGYIHMGAYETVVPGMENYRSLGHVIPFNPPVLNYQPNKINWPIALNAYYARVHRFFLFNANADQVFKINSLEAQEHESLSRDVAEGIVKNSVKWGQDVADAILAYAETDREGATQSTVAIPATYFPPVGPGLWVPTLANQTGAMFPFWGKVRTFAATQNDLIAVPPPYEYSTDPSSKYYLDHVEVANVVNNLTYEDRWIAEFWSDDLIGMTFSPPGRIFAIANQLIAAEKWNLEETLHMYCRLGIAINDASVAAWKSKYIYNTERPETYIHKYIDPNFETILGNAIGTSGINPAFPGYPSGHSTFAGVSDRIFTHFFGENYQFTDHCHFGRTEFLGNPRTYTTWTQMAEENAYSRIPLGVHIRMDCFEGLRLGNVIAVKALSLDLQK